ncbi:MFS transporter [Streptomyces sp. JW3]|uniref:MFS transporter n=1 Tax=Streptomyces sp. JW3 TaxID=3456955 RepID=UPI003FA4B06A
MSSPYLTQPLYRRVMTLTGIYLSFIFVISDAIVYASTLLPTAMADLGGNDLYALGTAIGGILGVTAMPFLGYFAARNPHLKPWLLGGTLVVLIAEVVVRGTSPNITVFLVASVFMSLGTAGCYVVGLPLIRDMFPVKRAGLLLGFVGTASSAGLVIGPLVFGRIIDEVGWRTISWLVAPALAVAAALIFLGARPSKAEAAPSAVRYGSVDTAGAVLLTALITFLVLPLSLGTSLVEYGTWLNTLFFVAAAVSLAGLVAVVRAKKETAFLPSVVFRNRNTLALIVQVFLGSASALAVQTFMPLYVLLVLGGTAFQSGVAAAIYAIPSLLLGPTIGRIIGRTGTAKAVILWSTVLKVVVMAVFGIWILARPETITITLVNVAMLVAGTYAAGQQGATQTAPQIMIPPKLRTLGTATVSMQLSLGPIIGAAVFGGLIVGLGPQEGIGVAVLAAAVMGVCAAVPALFLSPLTGDDSVDAAEAAEEAVEAETGNGQRPAPTVAN